MPIETAKIFSRNYAYDYGVELSSDANFTFAARFAIDDDHLSYAATSESPKELVLTLPSAQSIDSVWLKSNIQDGELLYSTNGSSWTSAVSISGNSSWSILLSFTPATAQYWKLAWTAFFPGESAYNIYEIQLLEELSTFQDYPVSLSEPLEDALASHYSLADGRNSFSLCKPRWRGRISFEEAPASLVSQLRDLLTERVVFTIMPEPLTYPDHIYRVFIPEYSLPFANRIMPSGFSGSIDFTEV